MKPLTDVIPVEHHASREQMRIRKWSVRKLRRRPRSRDKIDSDNRAKSMALLSVKEGHHLSSSDDSKDTSIDSLNSVGKVKKTERNSLSSDDSSNADLKNNSTLYGKILNRSQNDLNVKNVAIHSELANFEVTQDIDPPSSEQKPSTANTLSVSQLDDSSSSNAKDDNKIISENKDSEKHCNEKAELDVLMFGCDVPKPAIDGNLELSSDQDSTAGEDEEFTDEEDIENLHPDMLLYKAAAAHNLPVMCAALAAGADKLWSNVNDKSRSALHQAIISVR